MSPARVAGQRAGIDGVGVEGAGVDRADAGRIESVGASAEGMPGVREPRQQRSFETFERLVSEAETLLVEGGPRAVTVKEVVDRADSSVGSFYARFDGRDTAIRYVQDRFWQRAADGWDAYFAAERSARGTPIGVLARLTRVLVRSTSADRERLRAFLRLALVEPELGLLDRTMALDARIVDGTSRLLAELLEDEEPTACREPIRCVLAAVRDAVLFRRPTPEQERRLILSLVRMAAAGAGIDGSPASYPELLELCRTPSRGG